MSKHRVPGLTSDLMKKGKHFLLIRNPLNILVSFCSMSSSFIAYACTINTPLTIDAGFFILHLFLFGNAFILIFVYQPL